MRGEERQTPLTSTVSTDVGKDVGWDWRYGRGEGVGDRKQNEEGGFVRLKHFLFIFVILIIFIFWVKQFWNYVSAEAAAKVVILT